MKKIVYGTNGIREFYTDDGKLKCYCSDSKAKEDVCECDLDDFDVAVSENGVLYAMTQSKGNLYVSAYNGVWSSECVLESTKIENYNRSITLISNNNWLCAFYILKHDEKFLLVHQIFGSRTNPDVICESVNEINFCIVKDTNRNIHIAYTNGETLQTAVYVWKAKRWENRTTVMTLEENVSHISMCLDEKNNKHIALCIKSLNTYKVIVDSMIVASSLSRSVQCCLINNKNSVFCVFEYYGKLLSSEFKDDKWENVKYFHCDGFEKYELVKISGQKDFDFNESNYIYTYVSKNQNKYKRLFGTENDYINYQKKLNNMEDDNNVEKFAGVTRSETKSVSEEIKSIKRAIESDDTPQILLQIVSRLNDMENILSKVVEIVTEINQKTVG